MHEAVRANVRASVDHLRHGSALLEQLVREDGLLVVGAEYSLETGVVDVLRPGARAMTVLLKTAGLLVLSNVFMTFAWLYMKEPARLNYLWAALCLCGAVYFVFRR